MESKKIVSEIRAKYDFSGGVRGKHAAAYHQDHSMTIHKKDGTTVTNQVSPTPQGRFTGNLISDSGDHLIHPYLLPLISLFKQHADPVQAAPMKKYMRDQFEYLGIKSPQFKLLMKGHIAAHGLPPVAELDLIARELWSLPQRELQYIAISFSERLSEQLPKEFIKTLETMLIHKSWWDTVDSIAGSIVGVHFRRFPAVREKYLAKWRKSEDFWLRRTTILFQLGYKKETDFPLLCDILRENLGSKEFFINKAIGWALRQYARTDPQAVKKFVKATPLHPLSRREAMKHLE